MSVTSTAVRSGPFTPNGVTTVFPFSFQAASSSELKVYRVSIIGTVTDIPSGYDVNLETDHTGSVTFTTAPAAGETGDVIYVESNPLFTQALEIENQGAFLASVHEEGFDRSAARDLVLKDMGDRALKVGPGQDPIDFQDVVDAATATANKANRPLDNATFLSTEPLALSRPAISKLGDIKSLRDWTDAAGQGDAAADTFAMGKYRDSTTKWLEVYGTPDGYDFGTLRVPLAGGRNIYVEGQTMIRSQAGISLFDLYGYDERQEIIGGTYSMDGAPPGSAVFRLRSDLDAIWGVRIEGIRVQDAYCAITDMDATPYYTVECEYKDILCRYTKGPQIVSNRSQGFMVLRDTFIDNTLAAIPGHPGVNDRVTWASIIIRDFIGFELKGRVHVVGQAASGPGQGYTPAYNPNAIGVLIDGDHNPTPGRNRFIWGDIVRVESSEGPGIVARNMIYLNMLDMEAYACLGPQVSLDRVNRFQLTQPRGRGAVSHVAGVSDPLPGYLATADVFELTSCSQGLITNMSAEAGARDAVRLTGCTDLIMTGTDAQSNNGKPINELSGCARNQYIGGSSNDNYGGATTLAGAPADANSLVLSATSKMIGWNVGQVAQRSTGANSFAAHKNGVAQAAILSATFTKLTFGTERYDLGGIYDTATSRCTPQAGPVRLTGRALVNANIVAGSELSILIYKNGAALGVNTFIPSSVAAQSIAITLEDEANGTDYYEVYVYLAGAGDKTVAGAATQTSFSCSSAG